ncbi:MAG: YdcF family protein [Saprospiraceae bacterium]|nr:YdcF family protein [Saprospiraceae bacterium]
MFSGSSSKNGVTQAAITKRCGNRFGSQTEDFYVLEKPSTTEEEAIAYLGHFGKTGHKLVLVTSDLHMPRAMVLFEKHGMLPTAAPADHILRKNYSKEKVNSSLVEGYEADYISEHFWWHSHRNNFDKFSAAMHEYIGLVWARL